MARSLEAPGLAAYAVLRGRVPDIRTDEFDGWIAGGDSEARVILWEIRGRAPLHLHRESTHYVTILTGTLVGVIDGKEYEAGAGTTVVVPRGKSHAHQPKEGVCIALDTTVPPYQWSATVWLEPHQG